MMKYRLTVDDSAHWYVIPATMDDEWQAWLDEASAYWRDMPEGKGPPDEPMWAVRLYGSFSRLTFDAYEIDD